MFILYFWLSKWSLVGIWEFCAPEFTCFSLLYSNDWRWLHKYGSYTFMWCLLCKMWFYYLCFHSVTVILLHCGSFCHENKFLVCVNIHGNKAHSDSDFMCTSDRIHGTFRTYKKKKKMLILKIIYSIISNWKMQQILLLIFVLFFSQCSFD